MLGPNKYSTFLQAYKQILRQITAYFWQDFIPESADKLDNMAEKLAQPFAQSQKSMYIYP